MAYVKYRWLIHVAAFLSGIIYVHWSLIALCLFAHYFISPAQAAQIQRINDIDDFKRNGDHEGLLAFSRIVNVLTFQSSVFSGVWYLVGLGLGYLF